MDNFTDIDEGFYVKDDELLSVVFNIISKDVVIRSILNMVDDHAAKKAKVARFVYPRKTREELWDTGCRDDIASGGVNLYFRVQAEFRADFRVPLTLSWSVRRRIFLLLVTRERLFQTSLKY